MWNDVKINALWRDLLDFSLDGRSSPLEYFLNIGIKVSLWYTMGEIQNDSTVKRCQD